MFGPRAFGGGFSLVKMIGGLSKTLGVVNEIIPIYKEAKPLVSNARNAINLLKEFSNNTTSKIMTNTSKNIGPIKEKILNTTSQNNNNIKGPTFFQ